MIKLIIPLVFIFSLLNSSTKIIDKKIQSNKEILEKNQSVTEKKSLQIKILAKQIENQNSELTKLENEIEVNNKEIEEHKKKLEEANSILEGLQKNSTSLMEEKKENEKQIVEVIINEFSSSIALKLADESSLKELIDSEIYTILSQGSKDEILKLNNSYELITRNQKDNQKKIEEISDYIKQRKKKKKELIALKKKYDKSLTTLEKKHEEYQEELKKTVQKQESLKQLLAKLNILRKEELEREKQKQIERAKKLAALKKQKAKKQSSSSTKNYEIDESRNSKYAKDIDLDVRMIGSSTSGVKISKYKGRKTIAPLESFVVVKNFGKYFDPIYKIELFNESIVLKTNKPQAKVKSIFNGKIVYAKRDAGMLENVVIIQHSNGLHTIYSHLDKISPSLKVGRWIKKGYVVGRVNDTLTFQATKNEMHVNPEELFRI